MLSNLTLATSHQFRVIEQLRQAVVTALQGKQVPVQSLRDIIDFMSNNEASFPHFRNSTTYKLFERVSVAWNKRQPPLFIKGKQSIQ